MLDGKDKVVIEGYTIYRNDRNGDGGGVLIAIKDVLKKNNNNNIYLKSNIQCT